MKVDVYGNTRGKITINMRDQANQVVNELIGYVDFIITDDESAEYYSDTQIIANLADNISGLTTNTHVTNYAEYKLQFDNSAL